MESPGHVIHSRHCKCLWSYFKNLQFQNTHYNSLHILKKTYMLCQIVKKSMPDGNP